MTEEERERLVNLHSELDEEECLVRAVAGDDTANVLQDLKKRLEKLLGWWEEQS